MFIGQSKHEKIFYKYRLMEQREAEWTRVKVYSQGNGQLSCGGSCHAANSWSSQSPQPRKKRLEPGVGANECYKGYTRKNYTKMSRRTGLLERDGFHCHQTSHTWSITSLPRCHYFERTSSRAHCSVIWIMNECFFGDLIWYEMATGLGACKDRFSRRYPHMLALSKRRHQWLTLNIH